jgi:hypothetical protein
MKNSLLDGVPVKMRSPVARFPAGFCFSSTSLLVTEGKAFYNPSNTALDAVVSF